MTDYDPSSYLTMIDAILGVADLEKITVKKIRNAIQELFAIDLTPHKQEMNDLILERYYQLVDKKETEALSREKREKEDHLMALRLQEAESQSHVTRRSRTTNKVVKKRTKSKPRTAPNTAFNAEHVVSPQLQAVVQSPRMSRPQVVKQLWQYIKANDLQDPRDKRKVICDDKLRSIFKKNSVGIFEMNKLLSNHIYKGEDIIEDENGAARNHMKENVKAEKDDGSPLPGDGVPSWKRTAESEDSSEISDVDD